MKYIIKIEAENEEELKSIVDLLTSNDSATATTTEEETVETRATETATGDQTRDDAEVDSEGMPYNAEYHASPPQFVKDGTWRAKRGKTEEAKAARAEFKASGGDFVAPEAVEETEVREVTQMPGTELIPTRDPVSFDQVFGKITAMLESNIIDGDRCGKLYEETAGTSEGQKAASIYQSNETARAALWDKLVEIEETNV